MKIKLSDIEDIITLKYIKNDKNKSNHFLYNTEYSMKIFNNDKEKIVSMNNELLYEEIFEDRHISYYMSTSNIKFEMPNSNYKECLIFGNSYKENLSFDVKIKKKIITEKSTKEIDIYSFKIELDIPLYVGYQGLVNNLNIFPSTLEPGGFFITKNNIKKFVIFRIDNTCTWPKYVLKGINHHHGSLTNGSSSYQKDDLYKQPQYLVLNINLNPDKLSLNIESKKSLINYNILIFIRYLTKIPLIFFKELLLSRFKSKDFYYDNKIIDVIDILFIKTENDLSLFKVNENDIFNENLLTDNYIIQNFKNHYFENDEDESKQNWNIKFKKMINDLLLPGVNSFVNFINKKKKIDEIDEIDEITEIEKNYLKGMTLYCFLEDILHASFQNQIYPNKYHLSCRRIASPGNTFETILIDLMKYIKKFHQDQIIKYYKNLSDIKNDNINIKVLKKSTNFFNIFFSMQDKRNSTVVKPDKNANFIQRYANCNLVTNASQVSLTKNLKSKDPDILSWIYLGISDTPDHGPNAGINRRLNVSVIINDKDFETHETLAINLYKFIKNFIKNKSSLEKNKNKIIEDGVIISMIDDCEQYIDIIEQDLAIKLYKLLIKNKRENKFNTNLLDIALIPYNTFSKLNVFLPIKKYRKLRINYGNKIPFVPMYIVEDGELLFEKIEFENINDLKNSSFKTLINKYIFIEYIGPEQLTYSNICENLRIFNSLPKEKKKLYDGVFFDNYLFLSILENTIFKIEKMPGIRATFANSQIKNSITSIIPDNINSLENYKMSICGYQEPCITNNIIIESNISKQTFGLNIILAFIAYNYDIEDAIIVNKNSKENGLFVIINTSIHKGKVFNQKLQNNLNIKFMKNSYKKLDEFYIPKLNIVFEEGDALYGNVEAKIEKNKNEFYLKDQSIPYKFKVPGTVDRILISDNTNYTDLKFSIRTIHYLERGHKMSNQCAQKATIGATLEPNEMPHNENGIRPDIIMNGQSISNRKTFNMIYQGIYSNFYNFNPCDENKKKRYIDSKSFSNDDFLSIQNYKNEFKKNLPDYSDEEINRLFNCKHTMFDPFTGCQINNDTFMSPIYFNRLSQLSDEKLTARNKGKLDIYNQPTGGGKQKGDSRPHRIGEMEINLLATHGCANIIYELSKDPIEVQMTVLICKNCTNIAMQVNSDEENKFTCLNCESISEIPIFEKHTLSKSALILFGILNFRGISLMPKYNEMPIIYP